MRKLLLIIFIIPLIVGCISAIKPEQLNAIKRIGAISLLGDELCIGYIGTTIFTQKRFSANVDSWKMDDFVQTEIQKLIIADGRYTYVDVPFDKMQFLTAYKSQEVKCMRSRKFDINLVKNDIQNIKAEHKVDTLIIVYEGWKTSQLMDNRTSGLIGYGLYRSSFLGISSTFSYTSTPYVVIDTGTMEELSFVRAGGFEEIDNKYWNDEGFENLSKKDKDFIEQSIKKKLLWTLQVTLKKINLIR